MKSFSEFGSLIRLTIKEWQEQKYTSNLNAIQPTVSY
jgi:hypothetical protein